jgi:hypothetical protein
MFLQFMPPRKEVWKDKGVSEVSANKTNTLFADPVTHFLNWSRALLISKLWIYKLETL